MACKLLNAGPICYANAKRERGKDGKKEKSGVQRWSNVRKRHQHNVDRRRTGKPYSHVGRRVLMDGL